MYRDMSELNSSRPGGRFPLPPSPHAANLTLFGHENFAKVPTTDAFTLGGIPFFRVGARTNDLGAGHRSQLSRTTMLELGYTLTAVEFEFGYDDSIDLRLAGGYAHQGSVSLLNGRLSTRFTSGSRIPAASEPSSRTETIASTSRMQP